MRMRVYDLTVSRDSLRHSRGKLKPTCRYVQATMAGSEHYENDQGISCLSDIEGGLDQNVVTRQRFSIPNSIIPGSSTTVVSVSDPDLVEELSKCLDSQHDVQELAAGLVEMEDELKDIMEDASFLQFPNILQAVFPLVDVSSATNVKGGENMAALAPSVSQEYLCPQGETNMSPRTEESVFSDHQAISRHRLLPLLKRILQRKSDESISDDSSPSEQKSSSNLDTFMTHAVNVATQLTEDSGVADVIQRVENEGSFFASEMSFFCKNLLKPESVPLQDLVLNKTMPQVTAPIDKSNKNLMKENAKSKTKSRKTNKQRVRISERNTNILREWLLEHADNPFPTDGEKDMLCLRTGLTLQKLNVWFINSRRRILAPLGLKHYHKEIAQLNKQ